MIVTLTAKDKLIIALDVPTMEQMKYLVTTLGERVNFYKVGMELYYTLGDDVVSWLRQQEKNIFLDLKLHDIPNTVREGVRSLSAKGVDLITIHSSGGRKMMEAAVEGAKQHEEKYGKRPKILAVTVLTSFDENGWKETGRSNAIEDDVRRLSELAQKAGVDGVVASAKEAKMIRNLCGDDFEIVTPGIRPIWVAAQDQARIVTPAEALRCGATGLVIGRPVTLAKNPVEAVDKIIKEIKEQGQ